MTVFEATANLYNWFSENDTFNMDKNFSKVVLLTETPEEDKAALELGLKRWEEMSMIEKSGDYWVLSKKLSTMEQNISIGCDVAAVISEFTTKYAELINDNSYACDPMDIKEKDIQALLGLCSELIKS